MVFVKDMCMFTHSDFCSPTTLIAQEGSNTGKNKEVRDNKTG